MSSSIHTLLIGYKDILHTPAFIQTGDQRLMLLF